MSLSRSIAATWKMRPLLAESFAGKQTLGAIPNGPLARTGLTDAVIGTRVALRRGSAMAEPHRNGLDRHNFTQD